MDTLDKTIEILNNTSQEELLSFLSTDDLVLKQIALLNINKINSEQEAELILTTLINHPSEIREYCSFLINKLMKTDCKKFFQNKSFLDTFEISIYDVNPKVCRNILEILPFWQYKEELFERVLNNCFELIEVLQEKNKDKNHRYTKNSFHLYWNLYSIGILLKSVEYEKYLDRIIKLLYSVSYFSEYTLREKGAFVARQLCSLTKAEEAALIIQKYKNDENFYVRQQADI
jgi:hypothetical protein